MDTFVRAYKLYIVSLLLMLLSLPMTAATSIINNGQDKDWTGGLGQFNTTEGNDFWFTYLL